MGQVISILGQVYGPCKFFSIGIKFAWKLGIRSRHDFANESQVVFSFNYFVKNSFTTNLLNDIINPCNGNLQSKIFNELFNL